MNRTMEQIALEELVREMLDKRPRPICVEITNADLSGGMMLTDVSVLVCREYSERMCGLVHTLKATRASGVLNIEDKFNIVFSQARKAFPFLPLEAVGHKQLDGGLGVCLPPREKKPELWFFFQKQANDVKTVEEAVNLLVSAQLVYLSKRAYRFAVDRGAFGSEATIIGLEKSLAVITDCFDCSGLVWWLERQPTERIILFTQLFY